MCEFFVNLDDLFIVICTGFHEVMICFLFYIRIVSPLFHIDKEEWKSRANPSVECSCELAVKKSQGTWLAAMACGHS